VRRLWRRRVNKLAWEAQVGESDVSRRRWWRRIPRSLEIAAACAAILGAGFLLEPKIASLFTDGDVNLELAEITVSNPRPEYATAGRDIGQKPATEPTVVATVRNRGEDTAWIDEARVTVLQGVRLEECARQGAGGGDVPHSKAYGVTLPEFPGTERRFVLRDLHVEVQPGHGVRPLLRFQKNAFGATDLYAINVRYVVDPGNHVLNAGRFVIGIPGPVERSGLVLPENETILTGQAPIRGDLLTSWCFRHNLAGVRRVIAQPGHRSADIAALTHLRPAPAWRRIANHSPPREAVEELLSSEVPDAVLYALDAAEQTKNPGYEDAVRKRAISVLARRGVKELDDNGFAAVAYAERLLSLGRTPSAKDLFSRAIAAKSAEEEHFAEEERKAAAHPGT
jgi:hypothetical protein